MSTRESPAGGYSQHSLSPRHHAGGTAQSEISYPSERDTAASVFVCGVLISPIVIVAICTFVIRQFS